MYRSYPHGLDSETLEDDLASDRELIADMREDLAQEPDNALMQNEIGIAWRSVGCYRYAIGEPGSAIRGDLTTALDLLQRAFTLGMAIDPYDYIQMLALSVVVGSAASRSHLAAADRAAYTNEDVEAGDIVYVAATALAAAVRSDKVALAAAVKPYAAGVVPKRLERYDRLVYFPLIELVRALEAGDSAQFEAALVRREQDFVQFFRRADQKNDPEALIDMPGLALIALARGRKLQVQAPSVYRPLDLLTG
jgi:hypothetical protein